MKISKFKNINSQLMLIFIYQLLLDTGYIVFINRFYSYNEFVLNVSFLRYLFSILLFVIVAFFFIQNIKYDYIPSRLIFTFLVFIYFIPLSTYIKFNQVSLQFIIYSIIYLIILFLVINYFPKIKVLRDSQVISNKFLTILALFVGFYMIYLSIKYTNFRIIFDIINVYGIRAESATYDLNAFENLFLSIIGIVIPILIAYFFENKKYSVSIFLLLVEYIRFSFDGSKSIFFFLAITVAVYVVYKKKYLKNIGLILIIVLLIPTILIGLSGEGIIFPSLFVRRVMFVPVQASYRYFEFFSEFPIDFCRGGILRRVGFDTLYQTNIVNTIPLFTHETFTNYNNGLIGDAMYSFGNLGCVLGPIIIGTMLRFLDGCTYGLKDKIYIPFLIYLAVTLTNSNWSTILLSHGFLIACLLFAFMERKKLYE